MKISIKKITATALMLALLVTLQFVSKPFGQIVTGSIVNLILIISTVFIGFFGGVAVGLLSPIVAFMLGIGTPLFVIVPFIMLGNMAVVVIFAVAPKVLEPSSRILIAATPILAGAMLKYMVLYFGVTKLAPMFVVIPEKQMSVLVVAFGVTQLITAIIGGVVATIILPVLKKAIKL